MAVPQSHTLCLSVCHVLMRCSHSSILLIAITGLRNACGVRHGATKMGDFQLLIMLPMGSRAHLKSAQGQGGASEA